MRSSAALYKRREVAILERIKLERKGSFVPISASPTRRHAFTILAAALAVPSLCREARAQARPSTDEPTALLKLLYERAAKNNAGGDFVNGPKSREKFLSAAFAALWTKAEAATPEGDVGPVDFDPVSNSQDPDIKSFDIKTEKQDAGSATLAVTLTGRQRREKSADRVIRYDFVRDAGRWRIDDIRGTAGGEPWSVRAMLTDALKN
jgi:hypothetical protein